MSVGLHTSLEPNRAGRTPVLSQVLATAPLLPAVAAAVAVWFLAGTARMLVVAADIIWMGAILCFLAGVRRGLAFRTPGGSRVAEIVSMFVLFVLGVLALLSPWPAVSLVLLIVGFGCIGVFDPLAARHEEAPPFFARLRPVQMSAAVVALLVVLVNVW